MEHRHHNRVETHIDSKLLRRGKKIGDGVIRDLSRDGLFVEAPIEGLELNQPLEVQFRWKNSKSHGVASVKGFIVHIAFFGIGLMLIGNETDSEQIYASIIHEILTNLS